MSDIIDQISSKWNILPGPAAFRPRGHPASAYTPLIEKGRPVLQGLLAIDFLAKEVNFYFFLRKRFVLQSIKSSAAFRYEYIFLLFGFFFPLFWRLPNYQFIYNLRFLVGHKQCPNMLVSLRSMYKRFLNVPMKDVGHHTWRWVLLLV